MFNYDRLRGRIREKCKTQRDFSKQMGISLTSTNAKLNNTSEFTQDEIIRAARILQIKTEEIAEYFFAEEVRIPELSENEGA